MTQGSFLFRLDLLTGHDLECPAIQTEWLVRPHLTPALSPPSDGAEREKRSQRLWKYLRLAGLAGCLDRQIMERLADSPTQGFGTESL